MPSITWRWDQPHSSAILTDDLELYAFKGKLATCSAIDYADHNNLSYPLIVFWVDKKGTFHVYTVKADDYARRSRTGAGFQADNARQLERDRLR